MHFRVPTRRHVFPTYYIRSSHPSVRHIQWAHCLNCRNFFWKHISYFETEWMNSILKFCIFGSALTKKNWCFLADLFWEICVTVYTYMLSGYLLVRQRLHKVFPKHLFSCLVDLRLFSDNLHQINIGKKDKIFMYIIKYIVVIYHICHWLKKQR